jgi:hypothetical protein
MVAAPVVERVSGLSEPTHNRAEFHTTTATGVRPAQVLPRHFGCAAVRGVLGLIEPTAFIEFEFFTSGCCAISAVRLPKRYFARPRIGTTLSPAFNLSR